MRHTFILLLLLIVSVNAFALKPMKDYKTIPTDYGIKYEEIIVQSGKAKIATWFLKQNNASAKTVLICNSDFGNMGFSLSIASGFYKSGFQVILFDYRGFGKSSAFSMDSNKLFYNEFCEDLSSVFNFYTAKTGAKPAVFGQSMGSIIASICYAENPKVFSTKFIFDSFIESLGNAKSVLFSLKGRTFTTPKTDQQYDGYINRLKSAPVLIFKGSSDNVSFDSKTNLSSPVWTIIPFSGGHMQGSSILGEKYWTAIKKHLGK